MKHIHSYYSPNGLYNMIIDGLNEIGKELSKITLEDLHPVDEFHIRGTFPSYRLNCCTSGMGRFPSFSEIFYKRLV